LKEEYLLTGSLESTNEPYAIAKISAIKLCRYFNEQYGTNFISVMPTNLYGPNDNYNLETAHVLPAIIRKFHLGKLIMQDDWESIIKDLRERPIGFGLDNQINFNNKESIHDALEKVGIKGNSVVVWGSGNVYREFLHVDDLADACLYLMENIEAEEMRKISPDYFVNVGTGKDILLKDLYELVKEIVGYAGEVEYDTNKLEGTPRKLLDVSRLENLGWKYKIKLREGLVKTYEWLVGE
jgi:GDP-L-fucose synthase